MTSEVTPTQEAPASPTVASQADKTSVGRKAQQEQAASNPPDNNPLWKGYSFLAFTSVVCCASSNNLKNGQVDLAVSIAISSVSFAISIIILLMDRFQGCFESFKFHRALDGKLEGGCLLLLVVWWIIGVGIMTKSDGVAYFALNLYFSSWLSLWASCNTLNEWSGSQDILTVQELTALSPTLRGWYCLFFSSMVVMGSAADMHANLGEDGPKGEASFAIAVGLISMLVSATIILVYYRILSFNISGGFIELGIIGCMLLLWTISVGILTQDGSVAASISGQCYDFTVKFVPGSNLYVFSWMCWVSVLDVAQCWKAMKAMAFAQAGSGQASDRFKGNKEGDGEDIGDDEDEDDGM